MCIYCVWYQQVDLPHCPQGRAIHHSRLFVLSVGLEEKRSAFPETGCVMDLMTVEMVAVTKQKKRVATRIILVQVGLYIVYKYWEIYFISVVCLCPL